jgi:hypothetical protein
MLSQEDDPEPEEAQERYRRYLVEWHGGEIKAEFAQTRNEERWVRKHAILHSADLVCLSLMPLAHVPLLAQGACSV